MRLSYQFRAFLIFAATFLPISGALQAAVINVPGDQPTIQAGINAANDFDEVVVAPNTYNEIIDFLGKSITVRSSGGAATPSARPPGYRRGSEWAGAGAATGKIR